jgi:hypothetical protein
MAELDNRRRRARIGVVFCVLAAGMALLTVTVGGGGLVGAEHLVVWPIVGVVAAIGVGLLADVAAARVAGTVLLVLFAGAAAFGLIRALIDTLPYWTREPVLFVWLANAVVSSLLLVWLSIRGIQVLLDRPLRATSLTARLAGGALSVVALAHLHTAHAAGQVWGSFDGTWSLSISATGTRLAGFPGWVAWHVALLLVSALLLLLRRRQLRFAATCLTALFLVLAVLVVAMGVMSALAEHVGAQMAAFAVVLALVPAYLAWWLRDELAAR